VLTRRATIGGIFAALAGNARAAQSAFRRLYSGSFAALLAARRNQPFLLVLWSITCRPCRDEFALFREMRRSYPSLPLVLISTDDSSDEAVAATALHDFDMEGEESWIFADDAQKLRYEIDPGWYGELPRAYFYDAMHRREGVSGSLPRERLESWLAGLG
jgi:hypothetical protein